MHTHTHITKPRVQRARVADDLPALPWLAPPRSRVCILQHDTHACSTVQAATGQHHSNSRSPDHSQPSPKSSVARQLERQPVGQPATQPHEATPAASRALSTHPRPASCSRTTAQSQSLMRSLASSPASTATPTSTSAFQRAFGTLATKVSSLAQRLTSFVLPERRQSDARARQSTPGVRRFHTTEEQLTPEGRRGEVPNLGVNPEQRQSAE